MNCNCAVKNARANKRREITKGIKEAGAKRLQERNGI